MKISVIMPVFNQLEYTRLCLESIKKSGSAIPYEVIAVDNGSTDGTAAYLKSKKIRVISNRKNLGVAKAWNQGVKAARGEYCCIINNDIIASPGWLDNLLKFHESLEKPGIVCPATREGAMNYDFDRYSGAYVKKMKDITEKGLFGWCMFVKKDRFKIAGYFDEGFKIGIGEDTDFKMRLEKEGYLSSITGSVFIHHFGSKTIKKIRDEKGNGFELKNIEVLKKRWGHGTESYLQRKMKSAAKGVRNAFFKFFYGHTLLEK